MSTQSNQEAEFDISSLLDTQLDDIPDLPEFKSFPPGAYVCDVSVKDKTSSKERVNGHPAYEVRFKLKEVIELANPNDTDNPAPVAPAETSVLYMVDNAIGLGQFKKILAAVAEKHGVSTMRECIEGLNGAEVQVVLNTRPDKTDKDKKYQGVVELILV